MRHIVCYCSKEKLQRDRIFKVIDRKRGVEKSFICVYGITTIIIGRGETVMDDKKKKQDVKKKEYDIKGQGRLLKL